jgi:hypothetical protein
VQQTLNLRERGFESHPEHFASLAQWIEPVFSNHQMWVRFLREALYGQWRKGNAAGCYPAYYRFESCLISRLVEGQA